MAPYKFDVNCQPDSINNNTNFMTNMATLSPTLTDNMAMASTRLTRTHKNKTTTTPAVLPSSKLTRSKKIATTTSTDNKKMPTHRGADKRLLLSAMSCEQWVVCRRMICMFTKLSAEQSAYHRRGTDVFLWRRGLQEGLLNANSPPEASIMNQMVKYICQLEATEVDVYILKTSGITKVLKALSNILSIPRDAELNFRARVKHLTKGYLSILDKAPKNVGPAVFEPKTSAQTPVSTPPSTPTTKLPPPVYKSSTNSGQAFSPFRVLRKALTSTLVAKITAARSIDRSVLPSPSISRPSALGQTSSPSGVLPKATGSGGSVQRITARQGSREHERLIITFKMESRLFHSFSTQGKILPAAAAVPRNFAIVTDNGNVELSKNGKKKSAAWGGRRVKGEKVENSPGRLNTSRRASKAETLAKAKAKSSPLKKPQGSPSSSRNVAPASSPIGAFRSRLSLVATPNADTEDAESKKATVDIPSKKRSTPNDELSESAKRQKKETKPTVVLRMGPTATRLATAPTRSFTSANTLNQLADATMRPSSPTMGPPPKKQKTRRGHASFGGDGANDIPDERDRAMQSPFAGIVPVLKSTAPFRDYEAAYPQIQYPLAVTMRKDPVFEEFLVKKALKALRLPTNEKTKQEETFHARPSVNIPMPDQIKAMLVDDWENVTKNGLLVPIPCPKPVNVILDDYLQFERSRRLVANPKGPNGNSHKVDFLVEVVEGLREYFEKCLGRVLLYKFERAQYLAVLGSMNSGQGEYAGKEIGEIYGAEHLCRLLSTLPELIAHTNMDMNSIDQLRDEIAKFTTWLGKHITDYFTSAYEHPGQEYTDAHREADAHRRL